jgi:hypothetical protein
MQKSVNRREGLAGLVLLIVVIIGLIGVYYGNQWFNQKYYIRIFDDNVVRYLDMPPYAERITSADYELIGICDISIGTSQDQINNFLKIMCNRYGYLCTTNEDTVQIDIRRNYSIKGTYDTSKLSLRWTPILPEKLKKAAAALAEK